MTLILVRTGWLCINASQHFIYEGLSHPDTQILTYPLQYLPILPYTCLGLGLRMLYLLHLFFLSPFLIGLGE